MHGLTRILPRCVMPKQLGLPGSVRVYIIEPLVWASSTEALMPFRWMDRSIGRCSNYFHFHELLGL